MIKKEIIHVINKKGFKRINDYFAYFSLEKLANVRHEFDFIFGVFNTPCTLIVTSDIKKIRINKSILNDSSILKIILVYDSSYSFFKGKSYIIIDDKSNIKMCSELSKVSPISKINEKNSIINKYKEIDEFESLLGKINNLEDELKASYESLYKLSTYKKSLNVEPFKNLENHQKEKLIYSITQFLRCSYLKESLDEYKSSDITVKWLKEEGIYFQTLKITFHELTLAIHFLRKQFI